jgi:hypothetical protein
MGKINDRFKTKQHEFIVPQATHIAGATVIQQLGLDTPMGLQRLLMIMLSKLDPESKGIFITLEDINRSIEVQVTNGRDQWLVKGEKDQIYMRMCTLAEIAQTQLHEERNAPGVQ